MDKKLNALIQQLKAAGLSPEKEARFLRELEGGLAHGPLPAPGAPVFTDGIDVLNNVINDPYAFADLTFIQDMAQPMVSLAARGGTLDELMERDSQRENDGFPRKIRLGKLAKATRKGNKVIVVPTTVEEKLIHDPNFAEDGESGGGAGGSGDGQEGEVIGEQPVNPEQGQGDGTGPGGGDGENHEIESNAYDLGKILTEQFKLPNLQNKGKKRSLTRFTYDLTDRNRGFGQLLDKKATLRQIVKTNIALGILEPGEPVDPSNFLIVPRDKVYRILSKEKDFESQAMVFFLRDYSGSMTGKPTEVVVSQHVMVYSWLLYQYEGQVETRFILHDTEAKEVDDFYTYYNSRVAGGTKVASAFKMVNEIVQQENLAQDYNIYVFHGTDGDDWDTEGKETLPEIEKMLRYTNRLGVTIAENSYSQSGNTEVEKYLKSSGMLEKQPGKIRLDVMTEDAAEGRIIEGIRKLMGD